MKFGRKVCANLWMIVEKSERVENKEREKQNGKAGCEASGGSVERIIEEVDADAGHAIFSERLNVRYSPNKLAFEGREGFDFFGNFQAKLKLGSFAELEARRKIRAARGDVHGLRRKRLRRTFQGKRDLHRDTLDETGC
jgi:hypothetical protein